MSADQTLAEILEGARKLAAEEAAELAREPDDEVHTSGSIVFVVPNTRKSKETI